MKIRTKVLVTLIIPIFFVVFSGSRSQAEEKQGGILEGLSRMLGAGSGLRDFLPKAGSIAKYEGIKAYKKDKITARITGTTYIDWIRRNGKEYFVRTYKEEEKATILGIEVLRRRESTLMMQVTSVNLEIISDKMRIRGPDSNVEYEVTLDPPRTLLQWPPKQGRTWEQAIQVRVETKGGDPKTDNVTSSGLIVGEETIYTSAGKFETWRVELRLRENNSVLTFWWAGGKWVVKWEQDEPAWSESGELVEFKEPGR